MRVIFLTVGTSAITNVGTLPRAEIQEFDRCRYQGNNALSERVQDYIKQLTQTYSVCGVKHPAEIVSLQKAGGVQPRDHLFLIASDTGRCRICAEYLSSRLRQQYANQNITVEIRHIPDLRVDDVEHFSSAMSDLLQFLDEKKMAYPAAQKILHITGGYKATIPFLSVWAMANQVKMVYLFEGCDQIITFPSWSAVKIIDEDIANDAQKLYVCRRMFIGLHVTEGEVNKAELSNLYYYIHAGNADLTTYGRWVVEQILREKEQESILPPPSSRISYGQHFIHIDKNVEKDRIPILNKRIEQLAAYLELPTHPNPNSLDFKELRGNPEPGSTHQMDAWSDRDAKRILGHYEGDIFVLDMLHNHL